MKKILRVLLHLLGFPLLLAAVLYFNWNIITTQTKNYGVFVFVGAIVTFVMAIIYYICYAAITASRRKQKSVFSQTLRLCMVVVITMTGLWCVCDLALPDFLADATSSTIYYEDLADGWEDRAEVNEDLLNTFIELSVKAGTLPTGKRTVDEAIEYYQSIGLKESVKELKKNEYYKSIGGLLEIQYQSINANGYQTFTHPWIDCATSGRLTIPCLVHLLLDKRELSEKAVTNTDFCKVEEKADGTTEITAVFFAEYNKDENKIELKNVNWTVLDMLGTDTVIDLSEATEGIAPGIKGLIIPMTKPGQTIPRLLASIASIVDDEELLNSPLSINLEMTEDSTTIALVPANKERGVLGYQEMAWLDSNGLIYALVTLFSCRKLYLAFAVWGVFINLLIGFTRGMGREEKEKRMKANAPLPVPVKKEPEKQVYYGKVVKW